MTARGTRGRGFPALARWLMSVTTGFGVGLFRRFGRGMRIQGRPLLVLETAGRRSGEPRLTMLGWFPDDREGSWIVTATNAGSARHPGWFLNMARHPDRVWVEIDGRRMRVIPTSLEAAEREAAWERIVALSPGYAPYRETTDRVIPVIRLTPAR